MKRIPEFRNEDDERKFRATADSMEYVDWAAGRRRKVIHLKPALKTLLKVFWVNGVLAVPMPSISSIFVTARQGRDFESQVSAI